MQEFGIVDHVIVVTLRTKNLLLATIHDLSDDATLLVIAFGSRNPWIFAILERLLLWYGKVLQELHKRSIAPSEKNQKINQLLTYLPYHCNSVQWHRLFMQSLPSFH